MAILVVVVLAILLFPEQCTALSVLAVSIIGVFTGYQIYNSHDRRSSQRDWIEKQQRPG
jgi:UDP-N-acetylmuramyl pentapeptide phosphotransferase/UDP-N-acetylglucosamine-1-phosphate transferase